MKSGFLRIFTIKNIKSNSGLLVYLAYNTSSKDKLKLYLMYIVCDIGFIVSTCKFVGFGDKTNDVRTKPKT